MSETCAVQRSFQLQAGGNCETMRPSPYARAGGAFRLLHTSSSKPGFRQE